MDIITHIAVQEMDDVIERSLSRLVGEVSQHDLLAEKHSDISQ